MGDDDIREGTILWLTAEQLADHLDHCPAQGAPLWVTGLLGYTSTGQLGVRGVAINTRTGLAYGSMITLHVPLDQPRWVPNPEPRPDQVSYPRAIGRAQVRPPGDGDMIRIHGKPAEQIAAVVDAATVDPPDERGAFIRPYVKLGHR